MFTSPLLPVESRTSSVMLAGETRLPRWATMRYCRRLVPAGMFSSVNYLPPVSPTLAKPVPAPMMRCTL